MGIVWAFKMLRQFNSWKHSSGKFNTTRLAGKFKERAQEAVGSRNFRNYRNTDSARGIF